VTEHGEKVEEAPIVEESNEPMLFAAVEEKPTFPAVMPHVRPGCRRTPASLTWEAEQGISGTVYVEFIIDKNGNHHEPKGGARCGRRSRP
jgi:hypothetical protein